MRKLDGNSVVKYPVNGKMKVSAFHQPAGFNWTHDELEQAIRGCLACPLGPNRLKFVFGEGDPRARLMFVAIRCM